MENNDEKLIEKINQLLAQNLENEFNPIDRKTNLSFYSKKTTTQPQPMCFNPHCK